MSATGRGLLACWARVIWAGWLLGVPLVVVLALLGEAVGVGGSQTLVGAGMGAGRLILGLLTGACLAWMLGRERAV